MAVPTIELDDGAIRNEVLVIGFAIKKNGTFVIESGDLALDEKPLVQALKDLGATAKSDEILKVPGSTTRLMVFTSLGAESKKYAPEILRRAAGSASRACRRALVVMQPRCKQVPPSLSDSISTTDFPSCALLSAHAYPPLPPPKITKSNSATFCLSFVGTYLVSLATNVNNGLRSRFVA